MAAENREGYSGIPIDFEDLIDDILDSTSANDTDLIGAIPNQDGGFVNDEEAAEEHAITEWPFSEEAPLAQNNIFKDRLATFLDAKTLLMVSLSRKAWYNEDILAVLGEFDSSELPGKLFRRNQQSNRALTTFLSKCSGLEQLILNGTQCTQVARNLPANGAALQLVKKVKFGVFCNEVDVRRVLKYLNAPMVEQLILFELGNSPATVADCTWPSFNNLRKLQLEIGRAEHVIPVLGLVARNLAKLQVLRIVTPEMEHPEDFRGDLAAATNANSKQLRVLDCSYLHRFFRQQINDPQFGTTAASITALQSTLREEFAIGIEGMRDRGESLFMATVDLGIVADIGRLRPLFDACFNTSFADKGKIGKAISDLGTAAMYMPDSTNTLGIASFLEYTARCLVALRVGHRDHVVLALGNAARVLDMALQRGAETAPATQGYVQVIISSLREILSIWSDLAASEDIVGRPMLMAALIGSGDNDHAWAMQLDLMTNFNFQPRTLNGQIHQPSVDILVKYSMAKLAAYARRLCSLRFASQQKQMESLGLLKLYCEAIRSNPIALPQLLAPESIGPILDCLASPLPLSLLLKTLAANQGCLEEFMTRFYNTDTACMRDALMAVDPFTGQTVLNEQDVENIAFLYWKNQLENSMEGGGNVVKRLVATVATQLDNLTIIPDKIRRWMEDPQPREDVKIDDPFLHHQLKLRWRDEMRKKGMSKAQSKY